MLWSEVASGTKDELVNSEQVAAIICLPSHKVFFKFTNQVEKMSTLYQRNLQKTNKARCQAREAIDKQDKLFEENVSEQLSRFRDSLYCELDTLTYSSGVFSRNELRQLPGFRELIALFPFTDQTLNRIIEDFQHDAATEGLVVSIPNSYDCNCSRNQDYLYWSIQDPELTERRSFGRRLLQALRLK